MTELGAHSRLTPRRFLLRMVAVGGLLALFQVAGLEILVYYITNPTWAEVGQILTIPGPVVVTLLSLFFLCAYLYVRPLLAFLAGGGTEVTFSKEALLRVQDRSVNFPYFMAVLAFPFYMVGGPLATWLVGRVLGWPSFMTAYGFFGGTVSVFLTAPMSVYGYHWVAEPVTRLVAAAAPELPPARMAGFRIPAQAKLIVAVIILVAAWTAYTVLVGYRQNQAMLENLEQVEQMLSPAARAELKDRVKTMSEPGARSSAYFRSRLGNLKALYLSLLLVACVMALVIAIAAAKEITRPIALLKAAAERVRQGRYQEPVELVNNDELAELGATFNRMMATILQQMQALTSVMERLHGGIRRMDEIIGTVLAVSAEQSTGATQQAAAVQQASSIAEEIAATARQIAEQAKSVDEIAHSTLGACRQGEQKLGQVRSGFSGIVEQVAAILAAMRELEDRFQTIYKMVAMTGEIAEQTELLALNAALEAAGAGLAGQRFMVVADATKRLANRAAEASREIRELVQTIQQATMKTIRIAEGGQDKVAAGGSVMAEAMEAIRSISALADSTSRAVGEITLSTRQQTTGAEQLAGSVAEVHEVARKVEAGAKAIQAAITELQSFAETLRATVEGSKGARPGAEFS